MDEITLEDKVYVSSKRAAQITGYAKDYVGQLCREGRVEARLVGRNWYVLESSIRAHRFGAPAPVAGSGRGKAVETSPTTEYSSTWQPSSYTPEPLNPLPTVAPITTAIPTPAPGPAPAVAEDRAGIRIFEENLSKSVPPTAPVAEVTPEMPPATDDSGSTSLQNSSVVKEMQSAWHDWFSRTHELKVSEETLLENPPQEELLEAINASETNKTAADVYSGEEVSTHLSTPLTEASEARMASEGSSDSEKEGDSEEYDEDSFDKFTTPVPLEKLREPEEEEYEERIPLKRSYTSTKVAPLPVPERSRQPMPAMQQKAVQKEKVDSQQRTARTAATPLATGRIIRERKIVSKQKPSLVLQTLFLSIAGLAALTSVVGTGELDSLFSREHINYAPINYLVGESIVKKAN